MITKMIVVWFCVLVIQFYFKKVESSVRYSMESKNYQQAENSSEDENRVRQLPKPTLSRLGSGGRTKPEIKAKKPAK